jgi:hypothetical protein
MTNLILTSSPWLPLGAPNVPTPQPTNEMVVGTCQADIIEEKLNLFVLLSTCILHTISHVFIGGLDVSGSPNGPLKTHPSMVGNGGGGSGCGRYHPSLHVRRRAHTWSTNATLFVSL